MRIMVTGGAGFIGSHIADTYLAAGHDVSIVDDLSSGRQELVPEGTRFYEVDIREPKLDQVFELEKPELVCHQAARANVRESFEQPVLYADVNVVGSVNLLECCRKHDVRKLIYASTGGAVYGEPQALPVPETHSINPLDPYGASKHHVEHYLHLYQANYGLEFTALRYPNVYGPRQDPLGEAGVVAIFIGKMLQGEGPVINGTGEQERDFVSVSDVAKANLLALERGGGQILNIGGGTGTTVNEIFANLRELTGYVGEAVHGPAKQGEVYKIYLDTRRAREELGWEPEVPLKDGLFRTVDYFRSASSVY